MLFPRHWFPGAAAAVDLDRVTALAEDRERLWAQVSAAEFLSRDEKRALVGYPAARDERARDEAATGAPIDEREVVT